MSCKEYHLSTSLEQSGYGTSYDEWMDTSKQAASLTGYDE